MALPTAKNIAEGFALINTLLANAPTLIADVAAAEASSKDPVTEVAAISKLLADVQTAFNGIAALVPAAPVPTTPAA